MAESYQDRALAILLEKTSQGRVNWQTTPGSTRFQCSLEGKYFINIYKYEDGFALNMTDEDRNDLFSISLAEEVFSPDSAHEERFAKLGILYELARRKALNIDEKMAEASGLLEKI